MVVSNTLGSWLNMRPSGWSGASDSGSGRRPTMSNTSPLEAKMLSIRAWKGWYRRPVNSTVRWEGSAMDSLTCATISSFQKRHHGVLDSASSRCNWRLRISRHQPGPSRFSVVIAFTNELCQILGLNRGDKNSVESKSKMSSVVIWRSVGCCDWHRGECCNWRKRTSYAVMLSFSMYLYLTSIWSNLTFSRSEMSLICIRMLSSSLGIFMGISNREGKKEWKWLIIIWIECVCVINVCSYWKPDSLNPKHFMCLYSGSDLESRMGALWSCSGCKKRIGLLCIKKMRGGGSLSEVHHRFSFPRLSWEQSCAHQLRWLPMQLRNEKAQAWRSNLAVSIVLQNRRADWEIILWPVLRAHLPWRVKLNKGGIGFPLIMLTFGLRSSSKKGSANDWKAVKRRRGSYCKVLVIKAMASSGVRERKTLENGWGLIWGKRCSV